MSKAGENRGGKGDELFLLRAVERFNLLLLALLIAGSWYLVDWLFARSVLVGGALAGGSFFWLKRAALRVTRHAAQSGTGGKINGKSLSAGFAVKFTLRLLVLALLLLLISTRFSINATGLVIGLSTVMVSVIIVVLFQGRMIFQENM